jgi:lysophospholipase L1-like esterase
MTKKWLRKALFMIIVPAGSAIMCMLLIETIGRISGLLEVPSAIWRFSPTKGYELNPGQDDINSYGLRDREFELRKPPNTYRIIATGDSFTYGHGIKSGETYVKQLEILLNDKLNGSGMKYEVLNAGVPGYNTEQELIHVNELSQRLTTDLLLLQFTLNDAELGTKDVRQRMWIIRVKEWVKSNFALYSLLRYLFKRLANRIEAAKLGVQEIETSIVPLKLAVAGESTAGWERCRQALEDFGDSSRVLGIPAVLVIYPILDRLDTYPYGPIHELLTKTANEYGIFVIDLLPAFIGSEAATLWVSPQDSHPNAAANAIAARSIFASLMFYRLIPASRSPDLTLESAFPRGAS